MTSHLFLQHLANGIALGSLYALIAIGYTMVYGILRLINFAHGDIFMMAIYFAYYGILVFTLPWYISFPIAVILTAILGLLIDKAAYKPLRQAPRISALISAIGVSFFLQNLGIVLFGGRPKGFQRPDIFTKMFDVGGIKIQSVVFIIPIVTVILLIALSYLVYETRQGMAMRAVSKDFETARLMAINVDNIVALTFAIGSALAAFGGIMWAIRYPAVFPLMGMIPGLKAFVAAVLGGIGSIPGAMIGGYLIGLLEILLVAFFPDLAGYRDAYAFIILLIILLVKPTGIIGEEIKEKV
ncbi:branched-chain amino acid ABC transporter permease [candidate division KSB3 bacterium]|uniref:Branched-chain amino acid ABC transporter permease n=1 Tax=candidate division KSB3 bacterium TaxID=2044937 RepID=A0A2G6E1V7_9BACT|nr:MAG: branched-chain amino acid ABC transporter permease [candidate division KSB3 bacterium]